MVVVAGHMDCPCLRAHMLESLAQLQIVHYRHNDVSYDSVDLFMMTFSQPQRSGSVVRLQDHEAPRC